MTHTQTLVMKFGGTSVGSVAAMAQVVEIISNTRREWPRMVVVTSALSRVTDLLLQCAASASRQENESVLAALRELVERHGTLVDALVLQPARRESVKQEINALVAGFANLCQGIAVLGQASPRALDAAAGLGERLAVRVLSAAVESHGLEACYVEATHLIVTDAQFQNARPDIAATRQCTRRVLAPILNRGSIPVVTGFIGATTDGVQTTLGRGGSDYSAAILTAALQAAETWIWTDVDGVMTADPHLVPEARTIPQLSYREAAEMANYGAKVLHPKTVQPVVDAGSTLRVFNTFNPTCPGTRLVDRVSLADRGKIKAVTALRGLKTLTFSGYVPRGSENLVDPAGGEDADLITILCPGLRNTPATAGKIFSTLGAANISVFASSYGASDLSMNLFVPARDTQTALRVLHTLIVSA